VRRPVRDSSHALGIGALIGNPEEVMGLSACRVGRSLGRSARNLSMRFSMVEFRVQVQFVDDTLRRVRLRNPG
jgi:hypothetical protein